MHINDEQIRGAAAAAVEVLSGASRRRTLALMERLVLAKNILGMVASGQLVIGQPAKPEEPVSS